MSEKRYQDVITFEHVVVGVKGQVGREICGVDRNVKRTGRPDGQRRICWLE